MKILIAIASSSYCIATSFADDSYLPSTGAPVTTTLEQTGRIRGSVIDGVTGAPAANVEVTIEPTKQTARTWPIEFRQPYTAKTNSEGLYEFPNLAAAEYNILATAPDRTCVALNSVRVAANRPCVAADLILIEGVLLEGRVQTLKGQPVSRDSETGERLIVGLNGPSRPKSGKLSESCEVNDEGRFRLRVPVGRTSLFIAQHGTWSRTWRKERFMRGIDVVAGDSPPVNFRIHDRHAKPPRPPYFERDPVRLPPPVDSERDAAEAIRDLGGFYKLDDERHVVQINMMLHDDGERIHNAYTNSDEALWLMPAFPRLKTLLLVGNQITDESIICLSELEELESLFIWYAKSLTDASAVHWAELKKLEYLFIESSQIGDETLKELGRLPRLTRMTLGGNAFTDQGLAHLANSRHIEHLSLGDNQNKFTDTGIASLAGLENLRFLKLDDNQITDEGRAHLRQQLPRLRFEGQKR